MIISLRQQFVVYAAWKCASSTLHARLAPYNDSPYDRFYDFNPVLQRVVHQHITCAEFACLPESRAGHFAASFVRSPYDRVFSGFRQIQRDLVDQPGQAYQTPWVRDHVMEQLAENAAQLARADYDFDRWVALLHERQVFEIGRNTSLPLHPAHYWTHLAGQPAVGFIGRVEQFDVDFARLCRLLQVEVSAPVDENRHGPTIPAAEMKGGAYLDRMNARTIDRIEQLFRDDFELFGYRRAGTLR